MKIPSEVAQIIRRLAYELDRYEVHLGPDRAPVRVVRNPPASLPEFIDVTSYAFHDRRGTVRTGPHAEECAILFDLVTDWHDNGVE